MRDEIAAGLKNAIERGYSLDSAARSFINAGYNPAEVKAAAESLTQGVSSILASPIIKREEVEDEDQDQGSRVDKLDKLQEKPKITDNFDMQKPDVNIQRPQPQAQSLPPYMVQPNTQQKSGKGKKILIIGLIILLVLILLAIGAAVFFGDQLLKLIA